MPRVHRIALGVIAAGSIAFGLTVAYDNMSAKAADPLSALKARYVRSSSIPYPASNPYNEAKAELGHALFFDTRLSGPETMSCATCHNPSRGWEDGLPVGVGSAANKLGRATPTILNLAWAELLMWDGRKDGLEDQATGPIQADVEMNKPMPELVSELSRVPGYRKMFKAAFGSDDINATTIAQAIATFERTVVSGDSPFDRWILGQERAISDSAKRGFVVFNGKGNCAACHSGWRFTDDAFHDIGLRSPDPGRAAQVPGEPSLEHAFKTPTLRNIALRAPYMHDGSAKTLSEVIDYYDHDFVERPSLSPEIHRLNLSPDDKRDVIAFLHTLTSNDGPVTVPVLPTEEIDQ